MNKHIRMSYALLVAFGLSLFSLLGADSSQVRLLIVTGGHDYEREPFLKMFQSFEGVSFKHVEHPQAEAMFAPEKAGDYDVIVFYDMNQTISEQGKANLVKVLKEGKGLVALHHCLASYQKWDEYSKIIGGKYFLDKRTVNGVEKPGSTYKHDVDFKVKIADPNHPVTKGLQDFAIHDETYGGYEVSPQAHPLLTTDEPTSTPTLAWATSYGKARVATIQLGHDHVAYENPNYRKLVNQAIHWVALKR